MTDLLAPLLYILDDEVEAFWCFNNLMEFSALCKPGENQVSLKHQLVSDYQITLCSHKTLFFFEGIIEIID